MNFKKLISFRGSFSNKGRENQVKKDVTEDNLERKIRVEIGKKTYTIVSDDDYLDHIKNGFEPDMVCLFNSILNKQDCVLDIGANIGCTSILFGELAKKVYSFEPSATTFYYLKKNVEEAKLENVQLLNYGLGSEPGKSTITFSPTNRSGGFVSNKTQASEGHTIETIYIKTLDEIINKLNAPDINFIKIDVEGFEGQVIEGGKLTIAKNKPVVVLELNHWCLNAFQRTSIPDFFDLLKSYFPILLAVHGNTYMNLHDENETYHVMYHHIINMKYTNIVGAFDSKQLEKFFKLFNHKSI